MKGRKGRKKKKCRFLVWPTRLKGIPFPEVGNPGKIRSLVVEFSFDYINRV